MGAEKPHMAIWIMVVPMGRHSEISKPYSSIYLEASQAMTDTTERKLAEELCKLLFSGQGWGRYIHNALYVEELGKAVTPIDYIERELLAYGKQVRKKFKFGDCHQVDEFCDGATDIMCFCCGDWVCKNCSATRDYWTYGRQRLCRDCCEEYDRDRAIRALSSKEGAER